jgi:hypothetical protein
LAANADVPAKAKSTATLVSVVNCPVNLGPNGAANAHKTSGTA